MKSTFCVATNGNDGWSGRLAEPNSEKTDGPFATLVRARDAVREIKEGEGLREPVTVMVRGGKYYLEKTFVLSEEDSGTRDCPVTYTAYPGEKPVLSGGRKISGWKPYKGKILQCEVPEARGGNWKFRQLFFKGRRQVRARYPNFDPDNPLHGGWAFVEGAAEEGSFVAFKYKPGTFKHCWAKPGQAEVFMVMDWGVTNIIPVKTIDEENCILTLGDGVKNFDVIPWFTPTPFDSRKYRFYVENVLEELDEPGEWCLDTGEGVVYFWPPDGSIEDGEVVVPVLQTLIDLRGAPVERGVVPATAWITISGFTFTETAGGDNMHREGHDGHGAMFPVSGRKYCGEALHMRDVEHCRIEKNHFHAVGGNGIYLESYNTGNTICENEISYAGACGVVLIGSKYFHPVPRHPIYNQVEGNEIHHCGVFDKYVAGVFLGLSQGNVIGHNHIHDMPHHAINLGNRGFGRNIVEYNRVQHACLETHDNGAINCWMEDPGPSVEKEAERSGHIIRYNFIGDTVGCSLDEESNVLTAHKGATFGISMDNSASNCFVYGNVIVRSGCAVRLNLGKNNIIENNIIVDCKWAVRYRAFHECFPQMYGFVAGNRFCRNIFYNSGIDGRLYLLMDPKGVLPVERMVEQSDYNLFFDASGREYTVEERVGGAASRTISFPEWQGVGFDTHSVIGDPLFVNPGQDDYRLKPESPALKLGFQPLPPLSKGD